MTRVNRTNSIESTVFLTEVMHNCYRTMTTVAAVSIARFQESMLTEYMTEIMMCTKELKRLVSIKVEGCTMSMRGPVMSNVINIKDR